MYLVGCLHFSILEKWSFIEAVLCVPEVHPLLIIRAMHSRVDPGWLHLSFFCGRLKTGQSEGCGWTPSGKLPGIALCRGCWL